MEINTTTSSSQETSYSFTSVFSGKLPRFPIEPTIDDDSFTIHVRAELVLHDHNDNGGSSSSDGDKMAEWTKIKAFRHSRRVLTQGTESEQRQLFSSMMTKLPYQSNGSDHRQNLEWGYKATFRPETLQGIVTRLLVVAHESLMGGGDTMLVLVRREQDMSLREYKRLSARRTRVDLSPIEYYLIPSKQSRVRVDRVLSSFGLRFEKVFRDCDGVCGICIEDFEDDESVIRTPCSHSFHGFCMLMWIWRRPICPYCRSELLRPAHEKAVV